MDLAQRHAWLATAYGVSGDFPRALEQRRMQERLLEPLIAADPQNMALKDAWVSLQRAYGGLASATGDSAEARRRFGEARATLAAMIAFEPENQRWKRRLVDIDTALGGRLSPPDGGSKQP
jgi:hypothetical protein